MKVAFGRPDRRKSVAIGKLRTFEVELVFVFARAQVISSEEEQTEVESRLGFFIAVMRNTGSLDLCRRLLNLGLVFF